MCDEFDISDDHELNDIMRVADISIEELAEEIVSSPEQDMDERWLSIPESEFRLIFSLALAQRSLIHKAIMEFGGDYLGVSQDDLTTVDVAIEAVKKRLAADPELEF